MKKALLITLEYPPQIGGVANYYYNLVQNLPPGAMQVLTNQDQALLFKKWFWPRWIKALWSISRIVKKEHIELLVVGQVLPLGTVAYILAYFLKIPYIVMTHAMDITYPQRFPHKKWLLQLILNSAEHIVTVSEYTRNEIKKLLSGRNQHHVQIIPPGPSITQEKYPQPMSFLAAQQLQQKKIILSVGRLVARKGQDRVIEALPEIIRQIPEVCYVIAGKGEYLETLKQSVKNCGVERYVYFLADLTNEQLAYLYSICEVFVMASRELENKDVEGFGIVYLEANSFHKPVIAGASGGVRDAVKDGLNGFLVEPENKSMLIKALKLLLTDPSLAKKLGDAGALRVKEQFSWPLQAQRFLHLLK